MVSSCDGYCTLVTFDDIPPAHHVQQHTVQLRSTANHHSVPLAYSTSSAPMTMVMTPMATPVSGAVGLPALQMRRLWYQVRPSVVGVEPEASEEE